MPCAPQFTAPANGLKLLVQEPFGLHTTLIVPPDLLPDPELLVPHPATATTRAATDSTRTRVRAIRDSISDLLHWMERPSWDSRGIRVGFAWDSHGIRMGLAWTYIQTLDLKRWGERPITGQEGKRKPPARW